MPFRKKNKNICLKHKCTAESFLRKTEMSTNKFAPLCPDRSKNKNKIRQDQRILSVVILGVIKLIKE